jgi:dihydroxyacid dehydratase/phosphogluconate dehydratase
VDLNNRRVDSLVPVAEWERRISEPPAPAPPSATPWQHLYREHTGQLHTGACLDFACSYRDVCATVPRHNH